MLSPCTDSLSLPSFQCSGVFHSSFAAAQVFLQPGKMSMLDMSEFGEAAEYLRKSYTEQLKLQTMPFDGKTPRQPSAQPHVCAPSQPLGRGFLWRPSPSLSQCWYLWYRGCCRIVPTTVEDRKISEVGKADFRLSRCLVRCRRRWPFISPDPEGQEG